MFQVRLLAYKQIINPQRITEFQLAQVAGKNMFTRIVCSGVDPI